MAAVLRVVLEISLAVHLLLVAVCVWRVWVGQNIIDRLIGADLIGVLGLSAMALMTMLSHQALYIDVALGLAALGYIVTILLAKFITDEGAY